MSALSISSQISTAQDWLHTQQGPTRNFNAILNYQEQIRSAREGSDGKDEKYNIAEGKNYHFDRWKWYWEQHTDTNGNLVGPAAKKTAMPAKPSASMIKMNKSAAAKPKLKIGGAGNPNYVKDMIKKGKAKAKPGMIK